MSAFRSRADLNAAMDGLPPPPPSKPPDQPKPQPTTLNRTAVDHAGIEHEQAIRADAIATAASLLGDCAGTPAGIAGRLVELAGPIADWIRTGRPPAETQRICAQCLVGAGTTVPLGDPECPHDEAWRAAYRDQPGWIDTDEIGARR